MATMTGQVSDSSGVNIGICRISAIEPYFPEPVWIFRLDIRGEVILFITEDEAWEQDELELTKWLRSHKVDEVTIGQVVNFALDLRSISSETRK